MTYGWKALLVAIVTVCTAQEDPIKYSASLIQYLSDQSPGIFDCWIFQLSSDPEQHETMDKLLQTDQLAVIPKRLILASDPGLTICRQPKLLLIFCDYNYAALQELYVFMFKPNFKESVKIIVFHRCTPKELIDIINVFVPTKLLNVVFVRTDHLEVQYGIRYRRRLMKWAGPSNFQDLFVDQTAELAGHPVRISFSYVAMETAIAIKRDTFNGRILEWIICTIEHINGSIEMYRRPCYENEPKDHCHKRQHLVNAKTTFDFFLEPSVLDHINNQFLSVTIPDQYLVAAPRGRYLTVYELLIIPFDTNTWILLVVMAIIGCLLMCCFPHLFQNDLILMPLCGFERQSLDDVSRLERFIIFPLIVLIFILSSVYESKIIAFMTSYPHVPNPRTFEDLLQAGMTIDADSIFSSGVAHDPQFRKIFKNNPANESGVIDPWNPNIAYCGISRDIRFMAGSPLAYDSNSQLSRFVILDRFTMGITVPSYFVGRRNVLRDRFHQNELIFFQAGLMNFWMQRNTLKTFGIKHGIRILDVEGSTGNDLTMDKLGSIFILWIVGCGLATLAFAGERIYVVMKSRGRIWVKSVVASFKEQMHRAILKAFKHLHKIYCIPK